MLARVSGGVTTTLIWDGWTCVKETTGSVVTRYVAPQGQMHSFERGGQVYQVHSDGHNGSVRAITDSTGAVVAHYEYGAWGEMLSSSSPFAGGFSYLLVGGLGVRYDSTTGLLYMRHRWFDPMAQRFISRDLLNRFNRYAYSSNPVDFIDPLGLTGAPQEVWGPVQGPAETLGWFMRRLPGTGMAEFADAFLPRNPALEIQLDASLGFLSVQPEFMWATSPLAVQAGAYRLSRALRTGVNLPRINLLRFLQQGLSDPCRLNSRRGMFVVYPGGQTVQGPDHYQARPSNNNLGVVYQDPASGHLPMGQGEPVSIRVMERGRFNPNGYVRWTDQAGQNLTPEGQGGFPNNHPSTHIDVD